jgi:hypothetical protein
MPRQSGSSSLVGAATPSSFRLRSPSGLSTALALALSKPCHVLDELGALLGLGVIVLAPGRTRIYGCHRSGTALGGVAGDAIIDGLGRVGLSPGVPDVLQVSPASHAVTLLTCSVSVSPSSRRTSLLLPLVRHSIAFLVMRPGYLSLT